MGTCHGGPLGKTALEAGGDTLAWGRSRMALAKSRRSPGTGLSRQPTLQPLYLLSHLGKRPASNLERCCLSPFPAL
eukprot:2654151-Pyramimonas_sp.AAC.1